VVTISHLNNIALPFETKYMDENKENFSITIPQSKQYKKVNCNSLRNQKHVESHKFLSPYVFQFHFQKNTEINLFKVKKERENKK